MLFPVVPQNTYLLAHGFSTAGNIPISQAFERVRLARGWKVDSKRWRKEWNACMNAEYDRRIGSRVNTLDEWQELCDKVGIEEELPSITKCKKALSKVHVNLVDLLDCWDTDEIPRRFKSPAALAKYTEKNHKFFGRSIAKQDNILKVMLRRIL